jgi:hypothetical protein
MSANTCEHCKGVGSINSGRYEPCRACGGKGHGFDANVRCNVCKGSGDSDVAIMELCPNCHGTGHDDTAPATDAETYDTAPAAKPAAVEVAASGSTRQPAPAKEAPEASVRRGIGSLAIIAGLMLAVYGYFWLSWRVESALGLGLTALLGSYFALNIAWLLFKLIIKMLQYALVFLVWLLGLSLAARFLGYRWPLEIQEFLVHLLDNLGLM